MTTTLFMCPHFKADVESLRAIELLEVHCVVCGRLTWENIAADEYTERKAAQMSRLAARCEVEGQPCDPICPACTLRAAQ